MKIHTYNNGLKFYKDSIFPAALKRYYKYINIHEPFEDVVFDHIIKNYNIKTFLDVGSAWGYYSILAKKLNKDINVFAFDPEEKMIKNARNNAILNGVGDIEFRQGSIPNTFKLSDIIEEVGQIDLIKIDIQGAGTNALKSAKLNILKIKNLIIGTHGKEHDECLDLLKKYGFEIKLDLRSGEIPIQPDGILWATEVLK